jgi:hypothetical protein
MLLFDQRSVFFVVLFVSALRVLPRLGLLLLLHVFLFGVELFEQFGKVQTAGLQFGVFAFHFDSAVFHDDDFVRAAQILQLVSDENADFVLEEAFDAPVVQVLAHVGVHGRQWVVQEIYVCFFVNAPGKIDASFLASTQRLPLLPDQGLVAVGEQLEVGE